jgi:flagellar basal body-associated protein FliL
MNKKKITILIVIALAITTVTGIYLISTTNNPGEKQTEASKVQGETNKSDVTKKENATTPTDNPAEVAKTETNTPTLTSLDNMV